MPRVVIAIPVRNEIERIEACLFALARQQIIAPDHIVLLLNNCNDGTAAAVRRMMPALTISCEIVERNLYGTDANAGVARRIAMNHASVGLRDDDVLITTDADGRASPNWVVENLKALQRGADAVCGRAEMDRPEEMQIPSNLREDDARERQLSSLLDELSAHLDPDSHDPLPRHTEHSGASIAVTVAVWRKAGGIPAVAVGEDRAFIQNLNKIDARIRHSPLVRVTVSARTQGRAAGGMADTIRRRMQQQDEFIDDAIEPAQDRYRRICLRVKARAMWSRCVDRSPSLATSLGLSNCVVQDALSARFFGEAWAELERSAPALRKRQVRFIDLPQEINTASTLCQQCMVPA